MKEENKEQINTEVKNIPKDKKSLKDEVNDLKAMFGDPEKVKEMVEQSSQYKKFLKKQKNFKLPTKYLKEVKRNYKKNKILIIYLLSNRGLDVKVGQKINETIYVDGTPHEASLDFTFMYKGIPTLVIPEWSLSPIGTKDYYEAVNENKTTPAAKIILRAIEAKQNDMITKPKMDFKIVIWIIIGAAIIFGYFMTQGK